MARLTAAKKPRNSREKVQEEYGSYIIEVADWETSYSFTVNRDDRFCSGSYGVSISLPYRPGWIGITSRWKRFLTG